MLRAACVCETTIRLGRCRKVNIIIVNNQKRRMTNGNSYLQAIHGRPQLKVNEKDTYGRNMAKDGDSTHDGSGEAVSEQ